MASHPASGRFARTSSHGLLTLALVNRLRPSAARTRLLDDDLLNGAHALKLLYTQKRKARALATAAAPLPVVLLTCKDVACLVSCVFNYFSAVLTFSDWSRAHTLRFCCDARVLFNVQVGAGAQPFAYGGVHAAVQHIALIRSADGAVLWGRIDWSAVRAFLHEARQPSSSAGGVALDARPRTRVTRELVFVGAAQGARGHISSDHMACAQRT